MMTLAFDFNGYPKPATGTILSTCANTSETIELGYVRVEMTLSPNCRPYSQNTSNPIQQRRILTGPSLSGSKGWSNRSKVWWGAKLSIQAHLG